MCVLSSVAIISNSVWGRIYSMELPYTLRTRGWYERKTWWTYRAVKRVGNSQHDREIRQNSFNKNRIQISLTERKEKNWTWQNSSNNVPLVVFSFIFVLSRLFSIFRVPAVPVFLENIFLVDEVSGEGAQVIVSSISLPTSTTRQQSGTFLPNHRPSFFYL